MHLSSFASLRMTTLRYNRHWQAEPSLRSESVSGLSGLPRLRLEFPMKQLSSWASMHPWTIGQSPILSMPPKHPRLIVSKPSTRDPTGANDSVAAEGHGAALVDQRGTRDRRDPVGVRRGRSPS